MNAIAKIEFHGHTLVTTKHNNAPHVAMRPIVDAIGLQWEAQHKRIQRHPVLSTCVSIMDIQLPGDTQRRKVTFLPLSMLNGWLFGVDANRVKPEIRDTLIMYQRECFDVLAAYWMKGTQNVSTPTLTPAQQRHIQQLVNKLAHQPGNSHANVYRSLKDKFMVGKYDQIPAEQYPAACHYLGAEPLEGEWMPAEDNEIGETLEQVVAKLTEQVKKPNSYPASLFLPLVDAVLGRMGGVPPMPEAQWREIDTRLSRLGQLFHPLSSQFEDVLGISSALRGMDPVSGARQEGFGRLARR